MLGSSCRSPRIAVPVLNGTSTPQLGLDGLADHAPENIPPTSGLEKIDDGPRHWFDGVSMIYMAP